jgi:hypothetical protein
VETVYDFVMLKFLYRNLTVIYDHDGSRIICSWNCDSFGRRLVLTYNFQSTDVQSIHGILHLIRDVLSIGAKLVLWLVPIWSGLGGVEV